MNVNSYCSINIQISNYIFFSAQRYEVRYSKLGPLLINEWDTLPIISEEDLTQGTLKPVVAGTGVNIYPKADIFESDKDYYVAMKAFDERNTPSIVSNIAKTGRFIPPGRIQNLKVNLKSSNVTLNFTAPGEDAMIGKGIQKPFFRSK